MPTGKVVEIVDGDTLDVAFSGGVERVRLWGIDAPESDQPYGRHATKAAAKLVGGQTVEVEPVERGPYGRIIGRVKAGGYDLARSLVRSGYAWHDRKHGSSDRLRELEDFARKQGTGLWAQESPVPPWHYRNRAPQIRRREALRGIGVFVLFFGALVVIIVLILLAV